MTEVRFVDTTLRDGQASLWAEGMRTGMMMGAASNLDKAGLDAIELIASSHFKKCVRELRENPWERIRLVAGRVRRTPLAFMMGWSVSAFDLTPRSVLRLRVELAAAAGIRRVQIHEPSNDMSFRVPELLHFAREAGLYTVLALVYSLSPRHTDEYYARKAAEAVSLGPDAIYIKDPGGLLTPERVQTLVPAVLEHAGGRRVELHSHCTTGLAPLCYLEAIRHGIRTVHTAIPPLANGSSQPSLFNIAHNSRALGHTPVVDEEGLRPVSHHFRFIAARHGFPEGKPLEYEHAQFQHQVPGGVISNLRHQLRQASMEDRLPEVLAEVVKVRRELGYPIMVTPFSQFVVSQAAINLMLGRRYAEVTDEVIKYALGYFGAEAAAEMDADLKDLVTSRPRARELADWEPPEPSLDQVRKRLGGPGVKDEELLLRYVMGGDAEVHAMQASGPVREYTTGSTPLATLVRELAQRRGVRRVEVCRPGLRLGLAARNPVPSTHRRDGTREVH